MRGIRFIARPLKKADPWVIYHEADTGAWTCMKTNANIMKKLYPQAPAEALDKCCKGDDTPFTPCNSPPLVGPLLPTTHVVRGAHGRTGA